MGSIIYDQLKNRNEKVQIFMHTGKWG